MSTPTPPTRSLEALFLRLGKISFVLLICLTILGLGEIAARLMNSDPQPGKPVDNAAQDIRRRFLINTRRDRTPFTQFGNPPYNGPTPGAKAEGEYRVVMLGGSTVEHGEPAIAGLLEEELKAHGKPNAAVFNYGVVASQSGQELARLLFDVVDLKPDLIVQYNGANDLISPYLGDPRPGYPFDFIVWENNPLVRDEGEYPALSLFLYGSALMRRCCSKAFVERFTHLSDVQEKVGFRSRAWQEKNAEVYVNNLVKGYRVSKAFGADYLGIFQPLVYYKEPRTPKEERMLDDKTEAVTVGREVVRRRFAELKQQGVVGEHNLVDMSDAFDGIQQDVFWNSIHHEQEFRKILAEKMRDEILALERVRTSALEH